MDECCTVRKNHRPRQRGRRRHGRGIWRFHQRREQALDGAGDVGWDQAGVAAASQPPEPEFTGLFACPPGGWSRCGRQALRGQVTGARTL